MEDYDTEKYVDPVTKVMNNLQPIDIEEKINNMLR